MNVNENAVWLAERRFAAIASDRASTGRSYRRFPSQTIPATALCFRRSGPVDARLPTMGGGAVRQASEVVADIDVGPVVPLVAAHRAGAGEAAAVLRATVGVGVPGPGTARPRCTSASRPSLFGFSSSGCSRCRAGEAANGTAGAAIRALRCINGSAVGRFCGCCATDRSLAGSAAATTAVLQPLSGFVGLVVRNGRTAFASQRLRSNYVTVT